jgi:hypothetical protein
MPNSNKTIYKYFLYACPTNLQVMGQCELCTEDETKCPLHHFITMGSEFWL